MNKVNSLIAFAVFSFAGASAVASDRTEVLAVIHQLTEGLITDRSRARAACADDASIIDSIAPMHWSGVGACAKWFAAFDDEVKTGQDAEPAHYTCRTHPSPVLRQHRLPGNRDDVYLYARRKIYQ